MKFYRVALVEGRDGTQRVYKVKAVDAGDAIDRINRKYRGDQPIDIMWVKLIVA